MILDIAGKQWSVTFRDDLYRDEEEYGNCTHHLCKIEVDSAVHIDQQRDALWHEILHAVDPSLSERVVARDASAQLQVIRSNPELMQFLTGNPPCNG